MKTKSLQDAIKFALNLLDNKPFSIEDAYNTIYKAQDDRLFNVANSYTSDRKIPYPIFKREFLRYMANQKAEYDVQFRPEFRLYTKKATAVPSNSSPAWRLFDTYTYKAARKYLYNKGEASLKQIQSAIRRHLAGQTCEDIKMVLLQIKDIHIKNPNAPTSKQILVINKT